MGDPAAPVPLSAAWLDRLADLIAKAPVNLVSRRDRTDVRGRHLNDCARVADHLRLAPGSRWMDLGTGGGIPGLVLARAFPDVTWVLIDARAKKVAQVAAFASALDLGNVTTVHARAEDLWHDDDAYGGYDGVISRAVGSLVQTIALARAFVDTGEIVAIRGADAHDQVRELEPLVDDLAVTIDAVDRIDGTIRPTWLVRVRGRGLVVSGSTSDRHALLRPTRGGSSDGSA